MHDSKPVLINRPEKGKWAMYQLDNEYMFKLRSRNPQWACTPNGTTLTTPYRILADRIIEDLNYFGMAN